MRDPSSSSLNDIVRQKRDRLLELIRDYGSCAVAFSGGLDSSVLAKAAVLALGEKTIAFTSTGPSMPSGEREAAVALARQIGIRHEVIATDELDDPCYQANTYDRCYFCKQTICRIFLHRAKEHGITVLVDGSNVDDRDDFRPGSLAVAELGVKSPLAECGFTKAELRKLARDWELPTHDKPSSPCLATRIAYGLPITLERLTMVDRAEQFLHDQGVSIVRVRLHKGDIARIEVPLDELPRLIEPTMRAKLTDHLHQCGFHRVTIDLEGFRSGSMNQAIRPE